MSREGHIKRDASGKWFFVLDVTPPGAAQRKQAWRRGFRTKKDALEALDELKRQLATGVYVQPSKLTVERFFVDRWLPSLTVRPTTADTYRRLVRLYMIPTLGDVPLQRLDRARVAQWLAELTATGLSPKTVRNVHGVLSKALTDAVDMDLAARNVAKGPKALPRLEPRPPRAWTVPQLQQFLDGVTGDELAPLWRFLAMTGCRRGEALGVQWSEVDFAAATVTITSQRTIAGGSVVTGPPKTRAGQRIIAVDEHTLAVLRALRAEQREYRVMMGAGWRGGDLVFTHRDGTPLWPQRVTARFHAIAVRARLATDRRTRPTAQRGDVHDRERPQPASRAATPRPRQRLRHVVALHARPAGPRPRRCGPVRGGDRDDSENRPFAFC
jgi:integrase